MMADHQFAGVDDSNWGLQAIVGGISANDFCSEFNDSCYGVLEGPKEYDHHDLLFNFPDLFQTATMLTDDLEQLYKPFYPVLHSSNSSPDEENVVIPDPISVANHETKEEPDQEAHEEKKTTNISTASTYMPKYKRRKNQQKRVVVQVTAEELSSDVWAWRKYGQKPIKDSPYPRSYYRCSSTKGCLARKQVEQSCSDPQIFIVTYTEEHSHTQPTRKNALAGTIRHKFPNSKTTTPARSTIKAAKSKDLGSSSSSSSSTSSCPDVITTPLVSSVENIESPQRNYIKQELENNINIEEIIGNQQIIDDNNNAISGIKLEADDFFSGLEDLDGLISEFANRQYYNSTKQFSYV